MRCTLLAAALLLSAVAVSAAGQTPEGAEGFYRMPDLHGETIVFAAEGDLWTVPVTGGLARRLTSHPAEETDPVISPDGRTVAFTARYEGPAELYTMPLAGGPPTRRTYEAESSRATAWTPDGDLVYTTTHYSGVPKLQMVRLDIGDNTRSFVPLVGASEGAWDAPGSSLFFVRPGFHNNVTKWYRGGTARDIWKFSADATEAVELTGDYDGESHSPMWWNGRVYFVTDRNGTMNLWSMDEDGADARQHTRHDGFDIHAPSLADGRVVYQHGADLWLYDIASDQAAQIAITLSTDLDQLRERWVADPLEYLSSAHLSPSGDRVVLTARGRVFVAPVVHGRFVRASRKEGVRYRDAVFMPDGGSLLALSDETGELEFVRLPANGVGDGQPLTSDGDILRHTGVPSPDGARVAWTDNNNDLWLLEVATGGMQRLSENREGVGDLAWSPDSRWLAFSMTALNTFRQIKLYDTREGSTVEVTSDRVNSFDPAWDPNGGFLYFLSDRHLSSLVGSPWGSRQPEPYFDRQIEIYQIALREGIRSPFQPDDELSASQRPDSADFRVEVEGLSERVRRIPVEPGNYGSLALNEEALFMLSRSSGPDPRTDVVAVEIGNEDKDPVTLVEGVRSLELSRDGKKLLLRRGDALHVIDARPARVSDIAESRIDLSGWSFPIDVREDWRQIFVDAWRLERDWFYDPGLHGVDYEATIERYLPLVDRVTTRDELSVVIGWAVGELSALHTSVRGGDLREGPDDISVASLGARLLRDPDAGGYRIDYVYRTDPDYPDERSPLAVPGLGVRAGDVITAVNGVGTLDVADIGALLRNQSGKQVLLTIRSGSEPRDVIVTPAPNEANLRYSDWEYTRRLATEEMGEGQIGYVHLRAMGSNDLSQWYRDFYPVFNRAGLILDMRHNRGGNIDSFILEKLMRRAWMYWKSRVGEPYWNMQYAFRGHMVVLVDHETASDGEAFAEGFRRLGLGAVIGTRTWGGEIWLGSQNTLSDGGLARAPMNGVYGPEGEWLIEQVGVIPDTVIDNLPHETFNGRDRQLEAAIAHLKEQIAKDPRPVPSPPPYPRRTAENPTGR